jgi:excisionase family DNA binding protein
MESNVEVCSIARNGGQLPASPVMTLAEAAAYLHATVAWVRQQLYSGALSYQRIGKKHVVKRSEVEQLLARNWRRTSQQ